MKYNCLIVDDEHLARTLLENYISKIPTLSLAGKCKNPLEAIEVLEKAKIDIIFLDIQMPELTGIEFLKTLTDPPVVILTTAYQEYALESYQFDVTDYLLKPFSLERFLKAVNKAAKLLELKNYPPVVQETPVIETVEQKFLNIKVDHKIRRIDLNKILYIEGMKEYVTVFTAEEKLVTLESLKKLEDFLPANQFIRIHKSYIAAIDKITALDGNQVYLNKIILPVGKVYKDLVVKKVFSRT
ncbi:MAG: LytR/AlgR family response regulator transcription factor [Rhodothermaceae bacterium]